MQAEDIRFIENPFKKIYNIIKPDNDKLYNILFDLIQEFIKESKLPTLKSVASDPAQTQVDVSAYSGVNGYIYTLIRIYRFMGSEMMNKNQADIKISSLIVAEDSKVSRFRNQNYYLQLAMQQYIIVREFYDGKKKKKRSTLAFYMSETCTWLCGMHLGFLKNDAKLFRDNQQRLLDCYEYYVNNKQIMIWELLYGVAGFLYCFLELQREYDNHANPQYRTKFAPISIALTNDIINAGIGCYEEIKKTKIDYTKALPDDFRLIYLFHKKQYLGGAHGLGGNLNIILLSFQLNRAHDFGNYIPLLRQSIIFLLRHMINGNFSTSAGSQRIKLVHFCHGAPGIVTALSKFYLMFPEIGIQLGIPEVVNKSLNHIWDFGVLKKGFGLCHGISGNAYAFISPSIQQAFPEEKEERLRKAMLFGLLRQEKQVMKQIRGYHFSDRFRPGISDNPYSLMLGTAGDVCFFIDLFKGYGQFPGFDF